MQRVQRNDQQCQAIAAVPRRTPPRPPSRRRQRQQQIQPRLQAGGRIVADTRIPPGPHKLGIVSIGQPLPIVAVAKQKMGNDYYGKRPHQAGQFPPLPAQPAGVNRPLRDEPPDAATRNQQPLRPRQLGQRQAEGCGQQPPLAIPVQRQANNGGHYKESELPGFQPAGRSPHRKSAAAAHQPQRHPANQAAVAQPRQSRRPPQQRR